MIDQTTTWERMKLAAGEYSEYVEHSTFGGQDVCVLDVPGMLTWRRVGRVTVYKLVLRLAEHWPVVEVLHYGPERK